MTGCRLGIKRHANDQHAYSIVAIRTITACMTCLGNCMYTCVLLMMKEGPPNHLFPLLPFQYCATHTHIYNTYTFTCTHIHNTYTLSPAFTKSQDACDEYLEKASTEMGNINQYAIYLNVCTNFDAGLRKQKRQHFGQDPCIGGYVSK